MKNPFQAIVAAGSPVRRETFWLLLSDSALVALGLLAAVPLEFGRSSSFRENLVRPELAVYLAVTVLAWDIALYYNGLYELRGTLRRARIFVGVLRSAGIVCLVLACLYYTVPNLHFGMEGVVWMAAVMPSVILGWRILVSEANPFAGRADRVLIVGTGSAGIFLAREILSRPQLNMKIVGFLDERGENIGKSLVNPKILGHVNDVQTIVTKEKVDRVVLSLAEQRGCTPLSQLLRLKFAGVGVEGAHSFYEKITGRILVEYFSPSSLILADGFYKSRFLLAAKRISDVAISLVALVITFPLMGAAALAIWLETGAPILFRQHRVGLSGRKFEMLKFRSMYQDAEINGPRWAEESDPRITRVGHVIRKYRVDELPQFLNVLRGEMSLVGPRPEQPHFCELLQEGSPLFIERHSVRPGITGWAQIKYRYGSTPEEARTKLGFDLFYIKHLSVSLDLAIIFETIKVVLAGRGAR
jgi:sugar transferase (PEP-CTERM system associated)